MKGVTVSDYNNLLIDTPENVELDAEIAGFGTRCVAALIDYLIMFILFFILFIVFLRGIFTIRTQGTWLIAGLVGLQFILMTFYHLAFEFLWNGQTPGKRLVGVRVVQSNGLPATTTGLVIRNFLRLFDFFPIFYGIGFIVLFATKRTQRLGDLAAGTVVIRERKSLKLETVRENFTVKYHHIRPLDAVPTYIDVSRLTEQDRLDVVNYLQRRKDLRKREYIVGGIAARIAHQMGATQVIDSFRSPTAAEIFLEQVARAFEVAAHPQPVA
jgi:uncharacterized RDD family membrane protein YckC